MDVSRKTYQDFIGEKIIQALNLTSSSKSSPLAKLAPKCFDNYELNDTSLNYISCMNEPTKTKTLSGEHFVIDSETEMKSNAQARIDPEADCKKPSTRPVATLTSTNEDEASSHATTQVDQMATDNTTCSNSSSFSSSNSSSSTSLASLSDASASIKNDFAKIKNSELFKFFPNNNEDDDGEANQNSELGTVRNSTRSSISSEQTSPTKKKDSLLNHRDSASYHATKQCSNVKSKIEMFQEKINTSSTEKNSLYSRTSFSSSATRPGEQKQSGSLFNSVLSKFKEKQSSRQCDNANNSNSSNRGSFCSMRTLDDYNPMVKVKELRSLFERSTLDL